MLSHRHATPAAQPSQSFALSHRYQTEPLQRILKRLSRAMSKKNGMNVVALGAEELRHEERIQVHISRRRRRRRRHGSS
jgi:uncharacterized protein YoaH (UPF0181 family)